VNGAVAKKPSFAVSDDDFLECDFRKKFVGRGGEKLDYAINFFGLDVKGLVCGDVGASTGGFTDCMLQRGASKVYAIENGCGQLAEELVADSRVISLEKTNIITCDALPELWQFVAIDVSFVSVTKIIKSVLLKCCNNVKIVCLIKPQFECGRQGLNKRGILKDTKLREHTLQNVLEVFRSFGIDILGVTVSPVIGGDGNTEYLSLLTAPCIR
jgi:23S rRNA (cytidine1920-2'-O)/16S rRNA (cytidine1409-2'-O)-methyltransferase